MKNKLVWIVAIGLIILVGARLSFVKQNFGGLLRSGSKASPVSPVGLRPRVAGLQPRVFIEETEILVSVADTPNEREKGLSGVPSLPENTGKLFIFQAPERPGFWMKDMNFPIDIVWIGEDLKVVGISPNITPETYPDVFYPPQYIHYVLEVNAGFAQAQNITVGDTLRFKK